MTQIILDAINFTILAAAHAVDPDTTLADMTAALTLLIGSLIRENS